MEKKDTFLKRLTLLFLQEKTHTHDKFLNAKFASVFYVNSIQESKRILRKNFIDIVLIELENDYNEKFEFIRTLKHQKPFLQILLISSDQRFKTLTKAMEYRVNDYFKTNIKEKKLLKKLLLLEDDYLLSQEYEDNKQNLNLLKQYQQVTDKSSIVSKTDPSGRITYANDNFCKVSGYTKNELYGKNHNMIRHPDSKKETFKEMWNTIKKQKKPWGGILRNISKSGESYYVKSTITPILDKNKNIIEYIALRQNISSILSDKQHFFDRIKSQTISLLILIKIEGFEILEKFYTLTTIDKIEKTFGFTLLQHLPKEFSFDSVYNLDNGKYALTCNLDQFEETKLVLKEYLEKFIENVKRSVLEIDGIEYDINISLSYAMGKYMLFEDANAGLNNAIENSIPLCYSNDYSIKDQKEAKKNLDVIKMVKVALENYNIVSYFQPIINNKTQQIEKYESLVRLINEKGNILTPYQFLEISKKGTYYNRITQRVLENSFKMLHTITTKLSINLSVIDIQKEETREFIYHLLQEYKSDAHRLIFEILEDETLQDINNITEFIHIVKSQGVSIAIDDFGAGYSNFERLLKFEPDIIKIDGSLIKNLLTNDYNKNVVETIVNFAKKQNIQLIAEFVETKEIYEYLCSLEIEYSQGYYFGKPQEIP